MTAQEWLDIRRLLCDDATPGPWTLASETEERTIQAYFSEHGHLELRYGYGWDADATLIADMRTSLPLALYALEAVLELHRPVSFSYSAAAGFSVHEVCTICHDKAGVHECGCWRDEDQEHSCAECSTARHWRAWPCATTKAIETALGGEPAREELDR